MKNFKKDKFCPLPWIHLATRPNGDVRLCCTANASGAGIIDSKEIGLVVDNGTNMNLKNHSIDEIWNSNFMKQTRLQMLNGIIPPSCNKCFEEEKVGIKSKRNWETIVWNERLDLEKIVESTKPDGSLPVEIPYFDLRLGNLCNLKCIMCSPYDSSSWIKDWKIQFPQYSDNILKKDQYWNDKEKRYTWYQKNNFIESLKSQASYIKELYFAGGEPLLIPEHYTILEFMVNEGYSKDCILRYNSNGTEITDKILELWNHFKLVKFNFSIDAYGLKNDYIRYPSKWDNIEKNLKRLDNTPDNVIVNIACAVQILNVLYLDELVEWKVSQNFQKIHSKKFGSGLIGLHLVYLPSYLNIRVLPHYLKIEAAQRIYSLVEKFSSENFNNDPYGKQRWLGIVKHMMLDDWSMKIPALKQYLEITDKTRATDYRSIFSELKL